MLRAGNLNRRVTIQHFGATKNAFGQPVKDWTDLAKAWANIRVLNDREFISADSERSEATASIRIRYRKDITAAMRVVHKGDVYAIVAVLPDEVRREHVDLACKLVGQ